MNIILNGAATPVDDDLTMAQLIAQLGLGAQRVAVEVNCELVPRSTFQDYRLAAEDRVEIIHAVGGG